MKSVGSLIRDTRRSAGVTQAQLARRLGTTQPAVAKLEGEHSNPTLRTVTDALAALGHELRLEAVPRPAAVDESLIRRQLELSPAERLRQLEAMHRQARVLAAAGARARGERPG
jgi:transcriptional regulator with XRE-family HTH domain